METGGARVAGLIPLALSTCRPGEVAFWSGAGISVDRPTRAPVGNTLADRVLAHAFAPGTQRRIEEVYRELHLDRSRPRLETLLDVVRRIHGLDVLVDLLSDLRDPPSNGVHRFLARHLTHGGRHITANFDTCVERAAVPASTPVRTPGAGRPIHFHGSFADDPTGQTLGATLARIERGFPSDVAGRLDGVVGDPAVRAVVFVGYGGTDFFDADPYLRQRASAGAFGGRTVVWVDHSTDRVTALRGAAARGTRRQLDWLADAGASVCHLTAPTRDVLAALARAWGLDPPDPSDPSDPCTGPRPSWRPGRPVTGDARLRATLELFALMGMHTDVRRLLGPRPALIPIPDPAPTASGGLDLRLLSAQTSWAQGRYRAAARDWRRALGADWLAAREREGACQWIRGQNLRAYRLLRRALDRAARCDPPLVGEPVWLLAETLGRVVVHMGRLPDTRLLATRVRRRHVLDHLPDPDRLDPLGRRMGTHLAARIRSVRRDLGAPAARLDPPAEPTSEESFAEYEALHAMLNYRHGGLRRRVTAGGHVPVGEFRDLVAGFAVLGATGDAARVPLLPGAAAAFTPAEVFRGLRAVDFTWWHRLRLFAGYLLRRTLSWYRHRHRPDRRDTPEVSGRPRPGAGRSR